MVYVLAEGVGYGDNRLGFEWATVNAVRALMASRQRGTPNGGRMQTL